MRHIFCSKLILLGIVLSVTATVFPFRVFAFSVNTPQEVTQGDPFIVTVSGADISQITGTYGATKLTFFNFKDTPTALVGVELQAKIGSEKLTISSTTGEVFATDIQIRARNTPTLEFNAPENFGGNTQSGAQKASTALADDNQILAKLLWSNKRKLWTLPFINPLKNIYITDTYGYTRSSGGSLTTHKGTDFRAEEGTEVYAMNRGVVRMAKKLTVYGNTVVIDHGQGTMTMYMHLSKIAAKQGHIINQGDILGYTGSTGYAQGPHLHLSVRVSNKSVDPEKFLELLK